MLKKFLILGVMISWVFSAVSFAANPSSATSLGPQDDTATQPVVTTSTTDCLPGTSYIAFGYFWGWGGSSGTNTSTCPQGYLATELDGASHMVDMMSGKSWWQVRCCKSKVTYQPQQQTQNR